MTSTAVAVKVRLPGTASMAMSAKAASHETVTATCPPAPNSPVSTDTSRRRQPTAPVAMLAAAVSSRRFDCRCRVADERGGPGGFVGCMGDVAFGLGDSPGEHDEQHEPDQQRGEYRQFGRHRPALSMLDVIGPAPG